MASSSKTAILVVDVQRDFCLGGALQATDTPSLIATLQELMNAARAKGVLVAITLDWHPQTHASFMPNGGRWPVHCVAGSSGADLMPPLVANTQDLIVRKGTGRDADGYSAFEGTRLAIELRSRGINFLAVCGIATEYCVRATVMAALGAGFSTAVLTDLVRPVDPNLGERALAEMGTAGAELVLSRQWLCQLNTGDFR